MRQSRCSRACQVDTGKGSRIATAPSSTISRANRVRVAARDTSALELLMWPRSVVGRRAKRPTAPGRSGMSIAEVRRGKAALAVARGRFRWSPKSGSSSEVVGGYRSLPNVNGTVARARGGRGHPRASARITWSPGGAAPWPAVSPGVAAPSPGEDGVTNIGHVILQI